MPSNAPDSPRAPNPGGTPALTGDTHPKGPANWPGSPPPARAQPSARTWSIPWPLRIQRWLWRWRWLLATFGAAVAALAIIAYLRPEPLPIHSVVIAERAITAGQSVGPSDIRLAQIPRAIIPDEHFRDPEQVIGSVAAHALLANQVITSVDLLGPTLADRAPPGSEVLTVPLIHGADLITPGRAIRLYSLAPDAESEWYPRAHQRAPTPAEVTSSNGISAVLLGWAPTPEQSTLLSPAAPHEHLAYLACTREAMATVIAMMRAGPITAVVIPMR